MNIWVNFTSPETRMIFLHEAENRTILSSFIWTKHRNVTDGRTEYGQIDRQTDRRTEFLCLLQRSALRAMYAYFYIYSLS